MSEEVASILDEVAAEPDAVRGTVVDALPRLEGLREKFAGVERIFLTGNGTSLFSCEIAATWYRASASPHDPVVTALPAGEMRHNPPAFGDHDVLIALSASGVHRDVMALVQDLEGSIPVLSVTQAASSPLDEYSDLVLVGSGGPGQFPVMTKTFASTCAAMILATTAFIGDDAVATVADLLRDGADRSESAIEAATPLAAGVAASLADIGHGFVYGTGAGGFAAREAGLKLKEMALVHTEGEETWEVESGSATIIGPGTFAVGLPTQGPGRTATDRLSRLSGEWGATVVEVTDERAAEGSHVLPIPAGTPDLLAPFVSVPPMVMVAYHLAVARGIDPNAPAWTQRYAQQGLNHVVGSEAGT